MTLLGEVLDNYAPLLEEKQFAILNKLQSKNSLYRP